MPLLEDEAPTSQLAGGETATRRIEEPDRTAYRPPPAAPPPRPRPARRPEPAPRQAARRQSGFGRLMRGLFALLALILIAAAVAAAVIVATDDSTGVKLRDVAGNTVQKVADGMRQLVEDNTK